MFPSSRTSRLLYDINQLTGSYMMERLFLNEYLCENFNEPQQFMKTLTTIKQKLKFDKKISNTAKESSLNFDSSIQ